MPIEGLANLVRAAETAPLALLAALAVLAAAYQTRRLAHLQDELLKLAIAATSGSDAKAPNIGQLAVALTRADDFDLKCALEMQAKEPTERLGSLLVRSGAMGRKDLKALLLLQDTMKRGKRPNLSVTRALAAYARAKMAKSRPKGGV